MAAEQHLCAGSVSAFWPRPGISPRCRENPDADDLRAKCKCGRDSHSMCAGEPKSVGRDSCRAHYLFDAQINQGSTGVSPYRFPAVPDCNVLKTVTVTCHRDSVRVFSAVSISASDGARRTVSPESLPNARLRPSGENKTSSTPGCTSVSNSWPV